MSTVVIGIDPGPTTGIVALPYTDAGPETPMVLQCDHDSAMFFVELIIDAFAVDYLVTLAIEQFVVGTRAARSRATEAGRVTRNLIGALERLTPKTTLRPAVLVKPWATDRRLYAAGLFVPTAGMNHARDAARHALYAAVHAGLATDPMSTKAGAR